MARLSRIVIPETPHHVVQRGNRGMPVFFSDKDRRAYLRLVAEAAQASGTRCLAWCLMDNNVHLILVPADEDGLRATLAESHRRYTRKINLREGWRGHLFQGRFASYPMDYAHLTTAVQYIENHPVTVGMVASAEDWPWSSAESYAKGRRAKHDPLTEIAALRGPRPNWRTTMWHGQEADKKRIMTRDRMFEAIEARLRTGRPLAAAEWIENQEVALGRPLAPRKRGPKPKAVRQEG